MSVEAIKQAAYPYQMVLTQDPTHWSLYKTLASFFPDPTHQSHIFLKGAWHALEKKEYRVAKELSDEAQKCYGNSFLSRLIELEILTEQGQRARIPGKLLEIAQIFQRKGLPAQEVKAYKRLAQLEPTLEHYKKVIDLYTKLGKEQKALEWTQALARLPQPKPVAPIQSASSKNIALNKDDLASMMANKEVIAASAELEKSRKARERSKVLAGKTTEDDFASTLATIATAHAGHADAQHRLGTYYAKGNNLVGVGHIDKDARNAAALYRVAADKGQADAQCDLGLCYANGDGVAKDARQAVHYLRMAADQGHPEAQFKLGVHYAKGDGIVRDEKTAVRYYRLAADQGRANAQCNLGACYAKGNGVVKDPKEAVRYFRMAAALGHATAQYNLGFSYERGDGVPKDKKEAVRYYRLAADQGHVQAQAKIQNL